MGEQPARFFTVPVTRWHQAARRQPTQLGHMKYSKEQLQTSQIVSLSWQKEAYTFAYHHKMHEYNDALVAATASLHIPTNAIRIAYDCEELVQILDRTLQDVELQSLLIVD